MSRGQQVGCFLQAAFLAHQALRISDAIVVTLWRLAGHRVEGC